MARPAMVLLLRCKQPRPQPQPPALTGSCWPPGAAAGSGAAARRRGNRYARWPCLSLQTWDWRRQTAAPCPTQRSCTGRGGSRGAGEGWVHGRQVGRPTGRDKRCDTHGAVAGRRSRGSARSSRLRHSPRYEEGACAGQRGSHRHHHCPGDHSKDRASCHRQGDRRHCGWRAAGSRGAHAGGCCLPCAVVWCQQLPASQAAAGTGHSLNNCKQAGLLGCQPGVPARISSDA